MKKRFYIGLIIFAILLLALGRLIVHPPVARLQARRRRRARGFSVGPSTRFSTPEGI
jgi:hypothetical protein